MSELIHSDKSDRDHVKEELSFISLSRFHQLPEFDHSCQMWLAGHYDRHKKPPLGSLLSSGHAYLALFFNYWPTMTLVAALRRWPLPWVWVKSGILLTLNSLRGLSCLSKAGGNIWNLSSPMPMTLARSIFTGRLSFYFQWMSLASSRPHSYIMYDL
ncbi:hypothetical protein Goarm_014700, partial [Gossypium armourianum]|nr:hypothetical protein [Gossypium armourianum]